MPNAPVASGLHEGERQLVGAESQIAKLRRHGRRWRILIVADQTVQPEQVVELCLAPDGPGFFMFSNSGGQRNKQQGPTRPGRAPGRAGPCWTLRRATCVRIASDVHQS